MLLVKTTAKNSQMPKALPKRWGDEESFLMPELDVDGVTLSREKDNDDTAVEMIMRQAEDRTGRSSTT